MNSTDYIFLALAAASIAALIFVLLRQRPDHLTPPSVPLQRIGKSPHYRLPRGCVCAELLFPLALAALFIATGLAAWIATDEITRRL